MAFYNRFGFLMRQTISQNSLSNMPLTGPSMFGAFRCMSAKLFIGARIVMDRDTGRSRGFGFVTYASDESAKEAMAAMDGLEVNGRRLGVSYANENPLRMVGNN